MRITFLGGAGTVTGSKYLLTFNEGNVLVDCGLFQGLKRLRERNWSPFKVAPQSLRAVVLTHAHLDHSGYLPLLVRSGFHGPVYCTPATRDLLGVLLPDSARLQEEEARFANKQHYSKHAPAVPLYSEADAEAALDLLRTVEWNVDTALLPQVTARFSRAGHLLGAASVILASPSGRILFSGDLGRPDDRLMRPPAPPESANWVVIESTYGDRRHPDVDPAIELASLINRVTLRGGIVVIPSFAVGRAQLLLHLIAQLKKKKKIPDVPVYLNSPMAVDVTEMYANHCADHRLSIDECKASTAAARFVRTVEESKKLNHLTEPAIIVSASGMATGGRVLHHLKAYVPDPRNLILFVGHQAVGTRGAVLVAGTDSIKIHGEWFPVRAEIAQLQSLSAHADRDQLVAWLKQMPVPPTQVFVTHGEPAAADALRQYLRRDVADNVVVPEQDESFSLVGPQQQ
jgi:metallo-beta-lactamase family protein